MSAHYPETLIAVLALVAVAIGTVVVWFRQPVTTPDPWAPEVAAEMEKETCQQLCHGCLRPHDENVHFCEHCGTMVGKYTSLLPPLYYYSLSRFFAFGTDKIGGLKPWHGLALFLAGLAMFLLEGRYLPLPLAAGFVMLYWLRVVKAQTGQGQSTSNKAAPNAD